MKLPLKLTLADAKRVDLDEFDCFSSVDGRCISGQLIAHRVSDAPDDSRSFDLSNRKVTDHRVLLGLKLHMGDRRLQQTDRAGATLDIVSPLANLSSPLMFSPFSGREVLAP